jgi:hypothetical protein
LSSSGSTFKYPDERGVQFRWTKDIIPNYILPQIQNLARRDLKPTIRGMLYYLESLRVMPKNDRTYKQLIAAMSAARKGGRLRNGTRGKPTIRIDAFADNTRQIIKDFKDEKRSLEDYINDGIQHFKALPNGFKTLVPRWLDQPNYVEAWTEKQGWSDNLKQIFKGRDIVIAPNKGHSSIKFLHDNIERLQERFNNDNGIHVYILYLGDLDPEGWAMDNYMQKELKRRCGPWTTFKRIGITYNQIVKHLPHLLTPPPDILLKLSNPKFRAAKPFKEHFGSLFQVELDAMQLIPNFEKLITDPVDVLYDQEIHEQVLSRPEYSQDQNTIKEQIREALGLLIDELEDEEP